MAKLVLSTSLPCSIVPNTLPGTDGYHLVVSHLGSRDDAFVYEHTAAKLPGQTPTGAKLVWESLVEVVTEAMTEHLYRASVNGVSFELAISGSTTAINGEPTEGAYVSISPSSAIRNAAADISLVYSSGEVDAPTVKLVENLVRYEWGEISGTGAFRITGNNISVAGDDESLTVVAADGTEAVAEVIGEDGYGMFITARLPAALPPGKGKVVLKTHGKRTPEGELRVLSKSVTILAGEGPVGPAPTITSAKTRGESEGSVNIAGGILDVVGANLETATAVELHSDVQPTGEASLWQTMPATYADGKLTTGELDFDEKPSDGGFVRVATAGGSALYPITYCAH